MLARPDCTRSMTEPVLGVGGKAIVATARKLRSCSGACSPARGLRPPTTVADPQEAPPLEITAGAPRTLLEPPASGVRQRMMREAELELARQAEVSYKRTVADQRAGRAREEKRARA